ncbi:endonuclease III [Novisyntrophococcus fermenticellae]|uniref:endonuclease III n=1 Tax=Novisyntrophococcus fermenticellae TaxID=2068655 RepID=UPI001E33FFF0|nr:endonuclease III [Novisyntrophococcus fermenticellae]
MPRLTKKQRQENLKMILETLDERYGVNKAGFYHQESWQLLVAIMLSAQSTDKQVDEVLPALFQRFAHVEDMAEAPVPEIESYIKSVGIYKNKARNIKKCCQQIVTEYAGQVPNTLEEVLKLAGVGRKTGTLYLADAHGIPGITVDTHVFRISRRLGWAMGKNPQQVELELQKVLPVEHWNRINFQLIYLGREICTSRKAKCDQCPLTGFCPKLL